MEFQPEAVKLKGVDTILVRDCFILLVKGSGAFATRVEVVLRLQAMLMESTKVVLCRRISTLSPVSALCVCQLSLFVFNFFPFSQPQYNPLKLEQLRVS